MAGDFFTDRGRERLEQLEAETQERIKKKLREVRDWPDHSLERLNVRDDYELRIGAYRLLITWERNEGEEDVLYVKSVAHRRNLYDREL